MTDKSTRAWKKRRRNAIWSNPTFRSCRAERQRKLKPQPCAVAAAKRRHEQQRSDAVLKKAARRAAFTETVWRPGPCSVN